MIISNILQITNKYSIQLYYHHLNIYIKYFAISYE